MDNTDKPLVPVALFAYKRPAHLLATLEGLKKNNIPLLFAFSDGPKRLQDQELVKQVRLILNNIDWCRVKVIERHKNLGLGNSIRTGVTEILKDYDRLIVVEDDFILREGAYKYVVRALEEYQDNDEIISISLWNNPVLTIDKEQSGYFSKRFLCRGWATYRRGWDLYKESASELYEKCISQGINVLDWGSDIQWQVKQSQKRDLWYVGYLLTHFLFSKLTYFPTESLIINIGSDGYGENDNLPKYPEKFELLFQQASIPQNWPNVEINPHLHERFQDYFNVPYRNFVDKLVILSKLIKKEFSKVITFLQY